ncbi:MAG: methyltransferase, partial [Oscillospiraceae bacterium]|nr:methyltransferase [Oscillospiraceae bacterium]
FGRISALLKTPCSAAEAYRSAMPHKQPVWQLTEADTMNFTPRVFPDNVARALVNEVRPFDNLTEGGGKDMFGVDWEYVPVAGGSMVRPGNPMLEDMNDWEEKLVWPNPDEWDWEASSKENKDYFKSGRAVKFWFQNGWFERIISFMEFEPAIMALFDEDQQDAIHAFFDKLGDLYIRIIDLAVKHFPQIDCFYMHDDWGSQKETFFSPALVEEMIVPHMKKVTDHIHSLGRVAELHSCGMVMKQVPNMIKAGWDTWSGQPMNDTDALYREYGDQIVIGVIPAPFDPDNTPAEEQQQLARDYVSQYCRSDRLCATNLNGGRVIGLAFRQELYRLSREAYAQK